MRVKDPFDDIEVGTRKALLYTACAVLLVVGYALIFPTQVAIIAMILSLPVIIMLHEFGHFIMAKRAGMKVTEFFVGFGPRLWSFRRGETEYGVKAFVVGGYCRVVGMTNLEDVDPADEPRTYRAKPWHSKVLMAVAGPAVHFVIALVLIFMVLFFAGNYRDATVTTTLSDTSANAAAAGLQKGDQVVTINGTPVTDWDQVHTLIAGPDDNPAKPGTPVHVVVRRGGATLERTVPLGEVTQKDGTKTVGIGISPSLDLPHPGLLESIMETPRQGVAITADSLKALGDLFSPSGVSNYFHILAGDNGKDVNQANRPLSPVGFAKTAADAVRSGWVDAFGLLIVINLFVGLLNLVPLLPFDGGHIAVATYEKIASRISGRRVQVDVNKLLPIAVLVMAVLGFFLVTSLYLDTFRGVPNPF